MERNNSDVKKEWGKREERREKKRKEIGKEEEKSEWEVGRQGRWSV